MSLAENGNNGEDIGMLIGLSFWLLLNLVGVGGCICLLRMRGYVLGVAGVICSIVSGIPCCLIPVGFGIWALVVALDPDVKRFFGPT